MYYKYDISIAVGRFVMPVSIGEFVLVSGIRMELMMAKHLLRYTLIYCMSNNDGLSQSSLGAYSQCKKRCRQFTDMQVVGPNKIKLNGHFYRAPSAGAYRADCYCPCKFLLLSLVKPIVVAALLLGGRKTSMFATCRLPSVE